VHIYLPLKPVTVDVEFEGKTHTVTADADGAWLPRKLAEHMINRGLAKHGDGPELPRQSLEQQHKAVPSSPFDWSQWVVEKKPTKKK
jgi:hypothetical protein